MFECSSEQTTKNGRTKWKISCIKSAKYSQIMYEIFDWLHYLAASFLLEFPFLLLSLKLNIDENFFFSLVALCIELQLSVSAHFFLFFGVKRSFNLDSFFFSPASFGVNDNELWLRLFILAETRSFWFVKSNEDDEKCPLAVGRGDFDLALFFRGFGTGVSVSSCFCVGDGETVQLCILCTLCGNGESSIASNSGDDSNSVIVILLHQF